MSLAAVSGIVISTPLPLDTYTGSFALNASWLERRRNRYSLQLGSGMTRLRRILGITIK